MKRSKEHGSTIKKTSLKSSETRQLKARSVKTPKERQLMAQRTSILSKKR